MVKNKCFVTIYFTPDKKNYQIIHPSKDFAGDWKGLVDTVTQSDELHHEIKNYHSFEISST